MSSNIERNILTIIEPTIELDELSIPDVESGTDNSDGETSQIPPSKFTSIIPLVEINTYQIQGDKLHSLRLKNTGFYPTLKVVFDDNDEFFMARFFPKDGDIIKLFIRSQGDETTFKPIRIDFTVVDVRPVGGGGNVTANRFMVEGRMHVPNLFTELVNYFEGTSFDALLNIAEELQLGFASNVDETSDSMTWINPNDTNENFIKSITASSYLNDDSFFTAYIDPYYYLTFVEVNRFYSQEGSAEVSQAFSQNAGDLLSKTDGQQEDFPNFLTNMIKFQGGARYISKYQMTNETGAVSKSNGYKKYAQYWDLIEREYISEFVDPMNFDTPGYINATKGRIIDGESEGPRNDQVKYKYLGNRSENVHDEFMYSMILNHQNLVEVTKMGMVVELDTVNPALIRYSRIYCQILEYSSPTKNVLTQPLLDPTSPAPNKQERDAPPEKDQATEGIINEFLSGFYVISGWEYIQTNQGPVRTRLHLQRREFIAST